MDRMFVRGVSREEVKEIVLKGAKFGLDSKGLMHSRLYGIEVVYDKKNDTYKIVTLFRAKER
jgi:hypothetical protein